MNDFMRRHGERMKVIDRELDNLNGIHSKIDSNNNDISRAQSKISDLLDSLIDG